MINGTTVIKAKDTASAMEKVVKELGEDCVILSTKKVNGQVSITASNLSIPLPFSASCSRTVCSSTELGVPGASSCLLYTSDAADE